MGKFEGKGEARQVEQGKRESSNAILAKAHTSWLIQASSDFRSLALWSPGFLVSMEFTFVMCHTHERGKGYLLKKIKIKKSTPI